jgi:hypothetical protein
LEGLARAYTAGSPDRLQGWLNLAFAVRRTVGVAEAKKVLKVAENAFGTTSALLHFNLACYHCQLGEEALAMERLARAFRLDAAMKTCAMQDEDLRPLWPLISACS